MRAKDSIFDRILASEPINKGAAVIARGSGEHWEPKKKFGAAHFDAPPPMRPVPTSIPDLIGTKFGRLTVVGVLDDCDGEPRKDKKALWVVRCVCGDYETRTSKAIRNLRNADDRCQMCAHLKHLQRREIRDRTGRGPDDTTPNPRKSRASAAPPA